ncbi:unnamed protein product [Prunus armeniaca]
MTSLYFKTTGRQWKATGHPHLALRARRICFKTIGRQRKATAPPPPLSSLNTENLLQSDPLLEDRDWSPKKNDQLSPCCQTHKEEIEPFYDIFPSSENSSALVPHQSPTKEVNQKA